MHAHNYVRTHKIFARSSSSTRLLHFFFVPLASWGLQTLENTRPPTSYDGCCKPTGSDSIQRPASCKPQPIVPGWIRINNLLNQELHCEKRYLKRIHICRVGQNHTFIGIYGVHTVFLAGKSPYIRSYTACTYGSGQPYTYDLSVKGHHSAIPQRQAFLKCPNIFMISSQASIRREGTNRRRNGIHTGAL